MGVGVLLWPAILVGAPVLIAAGVRTERKQRCMQEAGYESRLGTGGFDDHHPPVRARRRLEHSATAARSAARRG